MNSQKNNLYLGSFCLLCLSIYPSMHASSQETVDQKSTKEIGAPIQKIEIKAKTEKELSKNDATTKIIVSSVDLTKFGDTNVIDAMKRVPGVIVSNQQIGLTGMPIGYTQLLIDGEPPRGRFFI